MAEMVLAQTHFRRYKALYCFFHSRYWGVKLLHLESMHSMTVLLCPIFSGFVVIIPPISAWSHLTCRMVGSAQILSGHCQALLHDPSIPDVCLIHFLAVLAWVHHAFVLCCCWLRRSEVSGFMSGFYQLLCVSALTRRAEFMYLVFYLCLMWGELIRCFV